MSKSAVQLLTDPFSRYPRPVEAGIIEVLASWSALVGFGLLLLVV